MITVPVCVECAVRMPCARNGFVVEIGWLQYDGDRFECPRCGVSVVVGFAREAHHDRYILPDTWAGRPPADLILQDVP